MQRIFGRSSICIGPFGIRKRQKVIVDRDIWIKREIRQWCSQPTSGVDLETQVEGNDDEAHIPVLMDAVLQYFEPVEIRTYVDGTLGAGGHARSLVTAHPELKRVVGFDKDPLAHRLAREKLVESCDMHVHAMLEMDTLKFHDDGGGRFHDDGGGRFHDDGGIEHPFSHGGERRKDADIGMRQKWLVPVHGDFSGMKKAIDILYENHVLPANTVDGILLDLGVSSMQLDTCDRGFSFLNDGPLDMRMDPASPLTAEVAVNTWSESTLGKVFREYGEERYWKSIARKIVDARLEKPITSTKELVGVIGQPGGYRQGRKGKKNAKTKHPATRVFQALRIAINGELESVARVIPDAIQALRPGGRLAIITFHSLEDRIVKWAFRQAAGMAPSDSPLPDYCIQDRLQDGEVQIKLITRKPVGPSEEEESSNVRSRSAKLRVVEKL